MKVNEIITSKFVEALSQNIIPWRRPWQTLAIRNGFSGRSYNGINNIILGIFGDDNAFLTFNQVKSLGGMVKKGSHSLPVVFCKTYKKENESGEETSRLALRYYNVFAVKDCDIKDFVAKGDYQKLEFEPVQACENLIACQKIDLDFGGNRACYNPRTHKIIMPKKEMFKGVAEYYMTMFHEMIHREAKELGQELDSSMDSESYSKEELTAEIGANFLAGFCGLDTKGTFDNSKAYIQGWSKRLQADPQLIISASSKAQKRFDSILAKMGISATMAEA